MNGIYLDNAATSFPKAPGVAESISNYLLYIGSNVNRGNYSNSHQAENVVFETRELICSLFDFSKPENVIFTKNITESLNVLLKGLLTKGDHVLISSMEHNAVMRPLNSLAKQGITYTKLPCSSSGELNPNHLTASLKSNTKAIIMTHASNVCGTILPLAKVGQFCQQHNLFFIADCAQTGGFLDISFPELGVDALAFTGHKSLLGPQGIGGFIINDRMAEILNPLIEGGTGSISESEFQPIYLPDKFEAGTPNIPGIFGLNAALKHLLKTGLNAIREKELYLADLFLSKVSSLEMATVIGIPAIVNRTAVISLDFPNHDNGEIAYKLNKNYNIMTRWGMHCAPSAHQTLGTFPRGTVRFSISCHNSKKEIDYVVESLFDCLKNGR